MYVVGLTGGMGSGKSTVARFLEELGLSVIDADEVAREIVAAGEPALAEIALRFGDHLVRGDGSLDRAGLAAVVFTDDEDLASLNAITHPRIAGRIAERLEALAAADPAPALAVVDHPLLVENGLADRYDAVVVVLAPAEERVRRLADGRGIDPDDARARMAAQADDRERRAVATHVIVNDGDLRHLQTQVVEAHAALLQAAEATGESGSPADRR